MRRGLVMLVPIEHALLRRMRIEHPGLGAVELRPVIRTFCALDIGRRNAAEHVASGFLRAHGGGRAGFVDNGGSIPDARVRKGAGLAAKAPRGGSGRNGRSKIESDCCESGKAGGDEGAPGRRPRSGDNADGASCGGCDVGLT